MCGISAYIGDDAVEHVLAALKVLEIRGYDSAGIASWNSGIQIVKGVGFVDQVFNDIALPTSSMAMGHVRWATHGKVSEVNAHPQLDCFGKIAVCHNGVIENAEQFSSFLANHRYRSETDTEIIAHFLEGKDIVDGMISLSAQLQGYNSFVIMSESRILASCGGPPLLVSHGQLASDASALTSSSFFALSQGDIVEIRKEDFVLHQGTARQTHYFQRRNSDSSQSSESSSTMFLSEVFEQPKAMLTALNNDLRKLSRISQQMDGCIVLTGAGSSKVACMWAKYQFMDIGLHVEVVPVGDWRSRSIPNNTLVIAVSQSGETGTLIPLLEMVRAHSYQLIAIVNTPWSYLAREAHEVLALLCGEERSVIASKSFMAECVVLGHLASFVRGDSRDYEDNIGKASASLARWLPVLQREINQLEISFERCFVCGEGEYYPIAHEGAMKLKEGAYVFAEPMVASEFKHEALPLMTNKEVVFWVGETFGGGIAQVAEIRARGGKVIGFSTEDLGFDIHVEMPEETRVFPPLSIVPFQLLTQNLANKKQINIDRPRNLAKAVTVR